MLLDAAIRFTSQGREKLDGGDVPGASPLFLRAQAIALELVAALRPELDPALRSRLSALYMFVHTRLVAANVEHVTAAADDALKILGTLRAMWAEAAAKMKAEGTPAAGDARVTA